MGVRRVRAGCEFVYVAAVDTPAVFQVEPLDAAPVSIVRPEWSTEPDARIRRYADLYGNPYLPRAMFTPRPRAAIGFGGSPSNVSGWGPIRPSSPWLSASMAATSPAESASLTRRRSPAFAQGASTSG